MAFLVAEFVLVMQFLWKYIDKIIGRGFSFSILMELLFYFAVRIIPEAVPVTILIASVMVFGNLSEKYELSSMKSAGISLTRIMGMGIVIAIFTAIFSLVASNYFKPRANYKFLQRYNTVSNQNPTLNFEEGVFNRDFRNFIIKIGEKDKDGRTIRNVLIYDNSQTDRRNLNMLVAKKGIMYSKENENVFVMELEEGEQYREMKETKRDENNKAIKTYPFVRTTFKSWSKEFDLSEFDVEAKSVNLNRREYDLMNSKQLLMAIDSFDRKLADNIFKSNHNFEELLAMEEYKVTPKTESKNLPKHVKEAMEKKDEQETKKSMDTKKGSPVRAQQIDKEIAEYGSFLETFSEGNQKVLLRKAKAGVEKRHDLINQTKVNAFSFNHTQDRYVLRFHQQYAWAFICIVFLFIGAPLGSIVRKGGYGYPLLISIIFFMMFIVIKILGEKLSRTGAMDPVLAAWLPVLVMIPIAFVLSYKALNDSDFSFVGNKVKEWRLKFFGKE